MRTSIMAPKTRFAIVLPAAQVTATAILTYWADRVEWIAFGDGPRAAGRFVRVHLLAIALRQVWRGVNAPALPFTFVGYAGTYPRILGFGLSELLYFAAVGLVWWFVGLYFDERISGAHQERWQRMRASAVLGMAWGLVLFVLTFVRIQDSLQIFPDTNMFRNLLFLLRNRPEVILTHILFVLWSVALLAFNIATLVHNTHRKYMPCDVPDPKS
jgi:hypothetical protein